MSLFGVSAPEKNSGLYIGTGDARCDRASRPVKGKKSQRALQARQESAKLFNDIVDTLFEQVPPEHCDAEIIPLSNGMKMIAQSLIREKVLHTLDGHNYQLSADVAADAERPEMPLMRVLTIAQWSPGGESDGSFRYQTGTDNNAVVRRYLGAKLEGVTEEERVQLALIEQQMAEPVTMNKKMITTLGHSIMTVYPEFKLPL